MTLTRNLEPSIKSVTTWHEHARLRAAMFTHMEIYESTRTGDLIRVSCDCVISSNHTYADWVNVRAFEEHSHVEFLDVAVST